MTVFTGDACIHKVHSSLIRGELTTAPQTSAKVSHNPLSTVVFIYEVGRKML